jgi:hypothetical protein
VDEPIAIQCPYCFEQVEILLEPDVRGRLVQDCEVCCNPWQLNVERDEDGHAWVHVERAQ